MTIDTYPLELRIMGTMLDTGILPDLEASDFRVEEFSLIFSAAKAYSAEHGSCDHVLLGEHLLRTQGLDKRDWLAGLAKEKAPSRELADQYADALKSRSDSTTLAELLYDLSGKARGDDPDVAKTTALEALRKLTVRKSDEMVGLKDALDKSLTNIERLFKLGEQPGITTGLSRLDDKLGGWQRSDLILLAARPAVGKTALMCNLALNASRSCNIVIISSEQPAEQIVNRMLAIIGGLPLWKFRSPRAFKDHEWPILKDSVHDLAERKITILDSTKPGLSDIERNIRDKDVDLLFVDYAQRLKASGDIYHRISAIAQGLKDIARDFEVPVVSLAQINRAGVGGATMANLKGSGDLEQEADQILLLEKGESENLLTLTVEKNRHGPTGVIDLHFDGPCLRFREVGV